MVSQAILDRVDESAHQAVRRFLAADVRHRTFQAGVLLEEPENKFRRDRLVPGVTLYPASYGVRMAVRTLQGWRNEAKVYPHCVSPATRDALKALILALRYERRFGVGVRQPKQQRRAA